MKKIQLFRLSEYVEAALQQAEYDRDQDGVILAQVPNASGFFSQGETLEQARENLRDAIEGNIMLALQLGIQVPRIKGVTIEERDAETLAA